MGACRSRPTKHRLRYRMMSRLRAKSDLRSFPIRFALYCGAERISNIRESPDLWGGSPVRLDDKELDCIGWSVAHSRRSIIS